ncbi:MAG TPA: RNA polymerase sigma factor [Bacteroidales bacterium]|nr:RNA polymerase sigma factor [Lentimicrobiaceae bacterium]HOI01021.1 RNA polymerase sigma factor [Bacteroidales bacterium]
MTALEFSHQLTGLYDNLHYFAQTLTRNKEEAEDLVHDTVLKALTHRDKFQDDTNLKAWTFTILKNTFINKYRRAVKANTIIDTTDDLFYLNIPRPTNFSLPDSEFSVKEIRKNIGRLTDEHRLPFEMHTQGYKYKEIADKLDLSIGTVKSRIFFARKKLMEMLTDYSN